RMAELLSHPGVVKLLNHGVEEGLPWFAMTLLRGQPLSSYIRRLRSTHGMPQLPTTSLQDANPSWTQALGALSKLELDPSSLSQSGLEIEVLLQLQDQTADPSKGTDGPESSSTSRRRQQAAVHEMNDQVRQMLNWLGQTCRTLAYLHGEGLVHCDLKPENLFVTEEGKAVLVDFGLASTFGTRVDPEQLDTTGLMAGTTHYISPEQIEGQWVDARADLYAIGCMLYEVVTGRIPFDADLQRHIYQQHLWKQPKPPQTYNPECPEALNRFILQLLSKQPRDRPGHVQVLLSLLEDLSLIEASQPPVMAPRPYLYKPSLSGRGAEMHRLLEAARSAVEGDGRAMMLSGETGIGKTRLAMELVAQVRRWKVTIVSGQSESMDASGTSTLGGAPLHTFRSLLTTIADHCRQEGPRATGRLFGSRLPIIQPYAPVLADLPGQGNYSKPVPLPATAALQRLFRAVVQTLEAWIGDKPLLMVFDDLHMADELSLACLQLLAKRAFQRPWMLLGLYRPEEASPALLDLQMQPGVAYLPITRLSQMSVEGMIRDMLGINAVSGVLQRVVSEMWEAQTNRLCQTPQLQAGLGSLSVFCRPPQAGPQALVSTLRSPQWAARWAQ
ncbi:MAG: AAA family ATPase, partial [Myxococcota bacterium]